MFEVQNYDDDLEELFVRYLISDPELIVRCMSILSDSHFHNPTHSKAIKFIIEYVNTYSSLPSMDMIKVEIKRIYDLISPSDLAKTQEWFLENFETFARHRGLEIAILSSPELLDQGRYGEVETIIKTASQIGLVKDLGTNYYADPKGRLESIRDNSTLLSTGWRDVDKKLYGGFNRGELTIFAGQPGTGKSLFLQNLGINWLEGGLSVLYITLELSEKLCSMRLDAMTTGYGTNEIMKNIDNVAMSVVKHKKKHNGSLQLKYMSSGSTVNDIRAYIKEHETQVGRKIDAVLIDYLDLCFPVSVKVSPSDQFIKDKYVSEEIRAMAAELDVLCATASQLNRSSYENVEFDPSNIAGGLSKVNTADNVIAIFVTNAMKEAGRYQIQFLKTRSSSGVGSKVDLEFSPKTLRISDLDESEASSAMSQTSNIMNTLKRTGNVPADKSDAPKSKASANDMSKRTSELRNLLRQRE